MNDQQLCDKLVEAGVIRQDRDMSDLYWPTTSGASYMTIKQTLSDWRVAGKCLERMDDNVIARNCGCGQEGGCDYEYDWLKDPRAIITAFVESLGERK